MWLDQVVLRQDFDFSATWDSNFEFSIQVRQLERCLDRINSLSRMHQNFFALKKLLSSS